MTPPTSMTIRPADRREEETMHLFDAEAREEMAACGADVPACDPNTVQDCLGRLIDGIHVGSGCRTCMACAAC